MKATLFATSIALFTLALVVPPMAVAAVGFCVAGLLTSDE